MKKPESDRQTAKKIIKIYKKKPNLYSEADVVYAKMIRKIYKKKKNGSNYPFVVKRCRDLTSTGSTGSWEPIKFQQRVPGTHPEIVKIYGFPNL